MYKYAIKPKDRRSLLLRGRECGTGRGNLSLGGDMKNIKLFKPTC